MDCETKKNYLPLFVDMKSKTCIIIGGGEVAVRKVKDLLNYDMKIKVISPKISHEMEVLEQNGSIEIERRSFRKTDIQDVGIVIAATDEDEVNREVAKLAQRINVPCNVVDNPALCTVIFPAIFRRGRLTIAISTGGASPAMARRIKNHLRIIFGEEYELALEILFRLRKKVMKSRRTQQQRRAVYEKLLDSNFIEVCKTGDSEKISKKIKEITGEDLSI